MNPDQIRTERKRRGLTQEQAAHEIGVSSMTWSRWERGTMRPTGLSLKALTEWMTR